MMHINFCVIRQCTRNFQFSDAKNFFFFFLMLNDAKFPPPPDCSFTEIISNDHFFSLCHKIGFETSQTFITQHHNIHLEEVKKH